MLIKCIDPVRFCGNFDACEKKADRADHVDLELNCFSNSDYAFFKENCKQYRFN